MKPNAWRLANSMKQESEIGQWLQRAKRKLQSTSETPAIEAQALLAHILNKPRSWILAHPETRISSVQLAKLDDLLNRLSKGEPLPYLLGQWEFFGLQFYVSPAVLIPRPETELMVETALKWLQQNPRSRKVADVGCGSGCIGITLAHHFPDLSVVASDISFQALQLAKQNIALHHLQSRVELIQADLLSPLKHAFDLICANLPYIPTNKLLNLPVVKHEPNVALDGGEDGLRIIHKLLKEIRLHTAPGGLVLLEIENTQKENALALASSLFAEAVIDCVHDLSNHPRLLTIQFP